MLKLIKIDDKINEITYLINIILRSIIIYLFTKIKIDYNLL